MRATTAAPTAIPAIAPAGRLLEEDGDGVGEAVAVAGATIAVLLLEYAVDDGAEDDEDPSAGKGWPG